MCTINLIVHTLYAAVLKSIKTLYLYNQKRRHINFKVTYQNWNFSKKEIKITQKRQTLDMNLT